MAMIVENRDDVIEFLGNAAAYGLVGLVETTVQTESVSISGSRGFDGAAARVFRRPHRMRRMRRLCCNPWRRCDNGPIEFAFSLAPTDPAHPESPSPGQARRHQN
jgi:hypothetical protein